MRWLSKSLIFRRVNSALRTLVAYSVIRRCDKRQFEPRR
jgi:hypothetical protein